MLSLSLRGHVEQAPRPPQHNLIVRCLRLPYVKHYRLEKIADILIYMVEVGEKQLKKEAFFTAVLPFISPASSH